MPSHSALSLPAPFADKTRFIRELENRGLFYVRFVRPHGFGKTHFLNLLDAYYDLASADAFASRFAGTDIGRNPTKELGQYFVLRFDFEGVRTLGAFRERVASGIAAFFRRYPLVNAAVSPTTDESSVLQLGRFFRTVRRNAAQRLLILIDNYDWFAEALFEGVVDAFRAAARDQGEIKAFYAKVKAATRDDLVARLIMTGLTEVSLDSGFTGFNIARDISQMAVFATMGSFTEAELRAATHQTIADRSNGLNEAALFDRLANDGGHWRFSADSTEAVFNAAMCLHTLQALRPSSQTFEPPFLPKLPDANVLKKVLRLADRSFDQKLVQRVLAHYPVPWAGLASDVTLTDENRLSHNDTLTALFRLGFLTFHPVVETQLVCPGKTVEAIFRQCAADEFKAAGAPP